VADELQIHDRPELERPILISAFRGWNDGGQGASLAAGYLARLWDANRIADVDPEDFFDFQATRPHVKLVDGITRRIDWPETTFYAARPDGFDRDVVLLLGVEPNLRWQTFTQLIVDYVQELGVELVVTLGSLLADVPHTRDCPVTGSATDPELVERLGLQGSRYEGPTGIVGVFQDACTQMDIPAVSYWAAVPHYVAQPPCPKATLALVGQLEDLLEISIPLGDLPEESRAWERGVDELADEDEEIGDYVRALEETRDTAELPEASGEAIAREFERYLKRRDSEDD
jgi:proteasome assembly chaperone (PAC2) family protein